MKTEDTTLHLSINLSFILVFRPTQKAYTKLIVFLTVVYVLLVQKVLTGAGEKWSEEEASQLLEDLMKYDTNGDGKFDYMGEYRYRGEASGQNIVK